MPVFTYKARDETGSLVKGKLEGESSHEVAQELGNLGYVPVYVHQSKAPSVTFSLMKGKRVKLDDLIIFTRQFHTIVRTGAPLVRGLQTLRDQAENEEMRKVLASILNDIQQGSSLGDAMMKHPKVFSPVYYNTIKAGETSGRLEEILSRLADLLEYELKVREEIKSATRYPIMVIVMMVMAFFVIITFVVPKFMTMFSRFEMELPLPTRILIATNSIIRDHWQVNILLVIGIMAGFRMLKRTEWGAKKWDQIKISLPIVGIILFKAMISRFARIFSTLSGSGVPILESMDIVSHAVGNLVIADRIKKIRDHVMEGTGIALPMSKVGGFPPMFIQMVSIGEETGTLEDMLLEVSRHYETEVDFHLRRLTTAIEPVLLIGLGGMVLLLALAVFMPLWNMVGIAKR
jgi:type II secretory pathway component PulF